MLSEITKKGILAIKGLMDDCKTGIADTNAALDVIDEKYRKIIAEEKKTLKANLSEYKSQLKQYEKMFSAFDSTAVKEVLGDFETTVTEEEQEVETDVTNNQEEPVIMDSIFPENNEPEPEEAVSSTVEESTEEVTATEEWVEEKPEAKPVVEDASVLEISEDGWPEFPEF